MYGARGAPTGTDPFEAGADELPTGTGFHGVQASPTAVKVRDPVVFLGGLSYTANLPSTKPPGCIDPGDTWGLSLGFALALNLRPAIPILVLTAFALSLDLP